MVPKISFDINYITFGDTRKKEQIFLYTNDSLIYDLKTGRCPLFLFKIRVAVSWFWLAFLGFLFSTRVIYLNTLANIEKLASLSLEYIYIYFITCRDSITKLTGLERVNLCSNLLNNPHLRTILVLDQCFTSHKDWLIYGG